MGGGMRQAGIIAAPGIVALDSMVDRLAEDHKNAQTTYKRLSKIPNLVIDRPDTNILFLELQELPIDAPTLSKELKEKGVLVYGAYGERTRLVFNRMVDVDDTDYVADAIEGILGRYSN